MVQRDGPGWVSRHKALVILFALFGIIFAAVGGWAVYLNDQIGNVPRIDLGLDERSRPERPAGEAGDAVNILLAGADAGEGPSIADAVAAGDWEPGSHRSDTIIVVHITADRRQAYLISVPRDTWTTIDGYGRDKINAAFSFGGPSLYVRTLEQFTGLRMDHLAIIDWNGFRDLTTALGGVEVYAPRDVTDPQDGTSAREPRVLEGEEALQYVRARYGLPNGDFDRIKRQQNFLRSVMAKLVSQGVLINPVTSTKAVGAITENLVLDNAFTNSRIRTLALELREIRPADVTFVTVPFERFDRINGQSVVIVDRPRTKALFGAVLADELDMYVAKHESDLLGSPKSVS